MNNRERYLIVLDDMKIEAEKLIPGEFEFGAGPAIERAEALAAAISALEEKENDKG